MLSIKELIGLKTALLLHDPPNKMWTSVKYYSHENVAKDFALRILEGTPLKSLYERFIHQDLVKRGDAIASSFDRWLLTFIVPYTGYYLNYAMLHNIFDPSLSVQLAVKAGVDPLTKHHDIANKLNNILKVAQRLTKSTADRQEIVFLYNLLYLLLEPAWYAHGLPPSLADTRTPTHTIFDHLYASASIANTLHLDGFSGYYVILDYPGIQRFVSAGRKAGDFWAASWILSNVVWRVGLEFAKEYGFDVLLTPTPRLNPYTFKSVLALIKGKGDISAVGERGAEDLFYIATCEEYSKEEGIVGKLVEEVCSIAKNIYGLDGNSGWNDLDALLSQPLIPAYMTLLLPAPVAESPEELAKKIHKLFESAWRGLYETIVKSLDTKLKIGSDAISKYIREKLRKIEDVLKVPPQGLRVFVVRIDRVYKDLELCLVNENYEICKDLGLAPDHKKLIELLNKVAVIDKERWLKLLAERLLYHVLVSQGSRLAPKYGYRLIPLPRSFYYYDVSDKAINYVVEYETSCTLCGDEPAILKLGKRLTEQGVVEYDDEALKDIKSVVGELPDQKLLELKKILKPGEALGPYCLFKRSVYLVLGEKLGTIMSTDDVALLRVSHIVKDHEKLFNRVFEIFEDKVKDKRIVDAVKKLYEYGVREPREVAVKDIEVSARAINYTFDQFVSEVNKLLEEACVEAFRRRSEELLQILHTMVKAYGLTERVKEKLMLRFGTQAMKIAERTLPRLCRSVSIPISYAIVKGDADNIGKVLRGIPIGYTIEDYLEHYVSELLKSIKERGKIEITGKELTADEVLLNIEKSYRLFIDFVKVLRLNSVLLTPAWHSAVSISLVLTALEDYKISKDLDGMLIFTGGDDFLAFYPIHTALVAAHEHRRRFVGNGFKYVSRFIPITSSIATGRSLSVRYVNLKDVMSEEIVATIELLENFAKKVKWHRQGVTGTEKDSVMISDSRAGITVLIPQTLGRVCPWPENNVYTYTDMLVFALLTGIISRNTPEDLDNFIEEQVGSLKAGLGDIIKHILRRNLYLPGERERYVKAEDIIELILGDLDLVEGYVNGLKKNLALEFFSGLFRILRRHVG